jgi:hypothetical protein
VLHQGLVSAKERWLYAAAWLPGDAATWKIERQRCECERKGRQSASTSYGFVPTILAVAVALLVDNGSSMPSSASSTTTALYQDSSGTTHGQTGHMAGGADGANLGGSSGYTTWVRTWWVRKTIYFWQKRSPNCDFSVLRSPPPYPLPKTYDEWVRCEG